MGGRERDDGGSGLSGQRIDEGLDSPSSRAGLYPIYDFTCDEAHKPIHANLPVTEEGGEGGIEVGVSGACACWGAF